MLVGLGYLVIVIALACGPFHAASAADAIASEGAGLPWWGFAGLPVSIAIAIVATIAPMRIGARNLRRIEF
jgi:ABC-2 type transport system permease protein